MNWLSKMWSSKTLVLFLLLIIIYLFLNGKPPEILPKAPYPQAMLRQQEMGGIGGADVVSSKAIGMMPPSEPVVAPTTQDNRLVIRDTSLSLVVANVSQVAGEIEKVATSMGGYLVNSEVTIPEGAANGSVTIRIPEEKRAETLTQLKKLAVKTVSENIVGQDVTDAFVDLEARLDVLNKTKTKFESILAKAEKVTDLLEVERELTNLQAQIDNLKGQQKHLEQSAKLTKIIVYLSTDEFALPYTPSEPWRPEVIFKEAVRSLVSHVRSLGTGIIWILVYAPVWLPLLLLVWWMKKIRR